MPALKDLKLAPLRRKPFSFTRKTRDGGEEQCSVLIQVLTGKEYDVSRAEAVRYVTRLVAEGTTLNESEREELVIDARNYEALQWALRDPAHEKEDNPPPWCTAMELREKLSTVEVGVLWRAYRDHEMDIGPLKHELTKEDYEAMVLLASTAAIIDPQEMYSPRLRVKVHHAMAKELLDLRARVTELEELAKIAEAEKAEAAELSEELSTFETPDDEG